MSGCRALDPDLSMYCSPLCNTLIDAFSPFASVVLARQATLVPAMSNRAKLQLTLLARAVEPAWKLRSNLDPDDVRTMARSEILDDLEHLKLSLSLSL